MARGWITVLLMCLACPATAQTWRLDSGVTFSRFEEQVKSEIGGVRGESPYMRHSSSVASARPWLEMVSLV